MRVVVDVDHKTSGIVHRDEGIPAIVFSAPGVEVVLRGELSHLVRVHDQVAHELRLTELGLVLTGKKAAREVLPGERVQVPDSSWWKVEAVTTVCGRTSLRLASTEGVAEPWICDAHELVAVSA